MPTEPSRFAVPFPPALSAGGDAAGEAGGAPAPGLAAEAAINADDALLAFVQQRVQPIPPARSDAPVPLAGIIGATGVQQIQDAGAIVFHAVGDTGHGDHSPQSDVAAAMAGDYTLADPAHSPAFFLHLGDVIYGANKDAAYRDQFYVPYRQYPGKIVPIAGNHDGEVLAPTDPVSLRAFQANFCATSAEVPAVAGTVYRETTTLPGVYWLLDAPFVQVVGLYSNVAENPGFLSGPVAGSVQKDWLVATLRAVGAARAAGTPGAPRKALIVVTHHPPFSSGGHAGSAAMLADLDDACRQAGDVWPDLVFSAHAHNYQRYTRRVPVGDAAGGATRTIPFLVAGGGGHGLSPVPAASGQVTGDHTFEASDAGYGYLVVRASTAEVRVDYYAVSGATKAARDSVTVALS
jgi:hypothetical protein